MDPTQEGQKQKDNKAVGSLVWCAPEVFMEMPPTEGTSTSLTPTPYTLHPTPYTLHTLHPTPYTLHPTPYTLHPNPSTLNPKS